MTITGTNFDVTPANNTVKFNGLAATVSSATATTVVAVAPAAGSTGAVTVSTGAGTATGPVFTYPAGAEVYIVGTGVSGPGYWKNGVFTGLPADCLSARCIFVSGSDVYTGGVATTYLPRYWKNGVGVSPPVTAGHNEGAIASIVVSGTDVYSSGEDDVNSAYSIPECWKNAAFDPLTYQYGGTVYNVFVSGSDVYAAGSQWNAPTGGTDVATYWKNGTPVYLTDGTQQSFAYGIFVVGSDVYVAGAEGVVPKVWKNGVATILPVPVAGYAAQARSIYVTGPDVYVAGVYRDLAKYWKNGVMYDLTTTVQNGSTYESAMQITGLGGDIYIVGNDASNGVGYWKNGVFMKISSCKQAEGIFVR